MNQPLVYIIILNWNGYKDTIECLESLKKITYRNYKIILIDNGSTDESVKILRTRYPKIKLIENKANLGFAGGCNIGIKYALKNKSEYVLLLNNDTVVDKNFLKYLINTNIVNEKVGAIGPLIYYSDKPNIIWSSGAYKIDKLMLNYVDYGQGKGINKRISEIRHVDFIWGCCILIKSNVFQKVGLLDEKFFMYTEDRDFCLRLQDAGFNLIINPNSKIWHKVSRSSGGENSYIVNYYITRNSILFLRKQFNGLKKGGFLFFYFIDRLIKFIYFIKHRRYKWAEMIILGVIHGMLGVNGIYKPLHY